MATARVTQVVEEAGRALGPVAILVNNAGTAVAAKVAEVDDALWARHLAVNLSGAFYMIRAVLPAMMAAGWGRIVNVASSAARQGYPYVTPYVAAKHGLLGLTRAVAMEVATSGVTVNAVCPGYTATDLTWESARRIQERTGRTYEEAVRALAAFSPQKRLIDPEEVAALVVLLASDEARGVTAQAWGVDGGHVQA